MINIIIAEREENASLRLQLSEKEEEIEQRANTERLLNAEIGAHHKEIREKEQALEEARERNIKLREEYEEAAYEARELWGAVEVRDKMQQALAQAQAALGEARQLLQDTYNLCEPTHLSEYPKVYELCERIHDFLSSPLAAQKMQHPEHRCQRCGGPNIVWSAPNELWNRVVGSPNGILCPVCFVKAAEEAGVKAVWKLIPAQSVQYHSESCPTKETREGDGE